MYIHLYICRRATGVVVAGGGGSGGGVASVLVYCKVICIKAGSEGCLPVTGQDCDPNTINVAGWIWT